MQLHLNTDELNLLADTLLERVGAISAQRLPAARAHGTADRQKGEGQYDDLLDKVLMRDLRLDADELEQVTDLLGERERALKEEIARPPNPAFLVKLKQKLELVEHVLERINEARTMF